jgi:hypothetical protein
MHSRKAQRGGGNRLNGFFHGFRKTYPEFPADTLIPRQRFLKLGVRFR